MKKLTATLTIFFVLMCAVAEAEDTNWIAVQHIDYAETYYKTGQYTKAIEEYRSALRANPYGYIERAGLINSYLKRAAYYNNEVQQYTESLNDLRSALFFLRYYSDEQQALQMLDAAKETEINLKNLMKSQKIEDTPQKHFETAKKLRFSGNFSAAATEFFAAAVDSKYGKESYKALGDIANIYGLKDMAVKYYTDALKFDDTDAIVHLRLAKLFDETGHSKNATAHYNYALSKADDSPEILNELEKNLYEKSLKYPNDAEIQANLGAIYQKQGNYQQAFDLYRKAEQLNPSNINTKMNLGTLYQVQKNYTAAISVYNSILQVEPNNAMAHYYKAQCLKASGLTKDAIREYRQTIFLDKNAGTAKTELFSLLKETMEPAELLHLMQTDMQINAGTSDDFYQFAYDLHKANKLNDATLFYKEALRLNPQYADAYINLAQVYKQLSQYDNAKSVIALAQTNMADNTQIKEYAQKLQKESSNLIYDEALKLYNAEKYDEAIGRFLSINPPTSESLIGIAISYQKLEKYKESINYYKKAFRIDSKNSEIAYYIAMLSLQEGNMTEAKTFANVALNLDAGNQRAKDILTSVNETENEEKINQAIDFYDGQKYAEATKLFNEVIAKDGKNSNAYFYLGLINDAQKNYNNAILNYEKAFGLNKDLIIAKYSIAVDYDNLKNYKKAYTEFQKFISLSPNADEYTEYAKNRLKELKNYAPTATK